MDLLKLFKNGSEPMGRVFIFANDMPNREKENSINNSKELRNLVTMGDPDTCYQKVSEVYKTLITTLSVNDIDDAWSTFKRFQKEAIEEHGKITKVLIHSTDVKDQKQVMGFVTFIGLLFRKHLVDTEIVQNWIENILLHDHRKFFRTALIHLVKDTVKKSIANGIMDNATAVLNKAIMEQNLCEEEERVVFASKEQIEGFQRLNRR